MPSLVEKAIQSHLGSGKAAREIKTRVNPMEASMARRQKEVGELALKFFDIATHTNFGRRLGSIATAGVVVPFNKGRIITYHGPFALEHRRVSDRQLTVAKQIRLYDYRNGARGGGNPTLHVEAALLEGIVSDPNFGAPGDYILSEIEAPRAHPENTTVEVRRQGDSGYSATHKIDHPRDPSWDEVLDDLELAIGFLETGRVAVSSFENGMLLRSSA